MLTVVTASRDGHCRRCRCCPGSRSQSLSRRRRRRRAVCPRLPCCSSHSFGAFSIDSLADLRMVRTLSVRSPDCILAESRLNRPKNTATARPCKDSSSPAKFFNGQKARFGYAIYGVPSFRQDVVVGKKCSICVVVIWIRFPATTTTVPATAVCELFPWFRNAEMEKCERGTMATTWRTRHCLHLVAYIGKK